MSDEQLEQVLPARADGSIEFDPPITLRRGGSIRTEYADDKVLVYVTRRPKPEQDKGTKED